MSPAAHDPANRCWKSGIFPPSTVDCPLWPIIRPFDKCARLTYGARLLVVIGPCWEDFMTEPVRTPTWRRGTTRSLGGQAASALLLTNLSEGDTLLRLWVSWRLVGGAAQDPAPPTDITAPAIVGVIYGATGQGFPVTPPDLSNIVPATDLLWYEQAGVSVLQPGTISQLKVRPAAGERYWSIEAQRRGPVGAIAVRGVYFCWDVMGDPDLWFAQVNYSALVLEP